MLRLFDLVWLLRGETETLVHCSCLGKGLPQSFDGVPTAKLKKENDEVTYLTIIMKLPHNNNNNNGFLRVV